MPILSTRQRSLISPLVTMAGFGVAAAIELHGQQGLSLDAVYGTGFATAAISALAPREPRKGPAHGHYYLRLLAWMAVIFVAVGALITLMIKIKLQGRASAWLWIAVSVLSLGQFVWAARFGRSEKTISIPVVTRQAQEVSGIKRLRLTGWDSVVLASSVLILLTLVGCLDRCDESASPSTKAGLLSSGQSGLLASSAS